ncbi:putative ABC transporter C family member 15 isoform X2 [Zea mays]|uniref:putative ABC transporter C family member 15 isoform X2 n=1 Tax=Zea mays TaxID=4577 RepID=UPI0009AADD7C|nr:putative ABC transporter C family member 15 isoform X2 [Zea mays]|eukprot:XP_020403749.1 putative ABC transporter C family member 15 isoform X2 [Zea mays]
MERGGLHYWPALAGILPNKQVQQLFIQGGFLDDPSGSTILHHMQEWQDLYSPCFWMVTFALIQLMFIMSILAQFLFKKFRWWRQRLKGSAPESNKQHQEHKITDIKLDISYKACKACCLLILGSHVLRAVFLQLHERISDCKYPPFIICEGLQVLSWIILSLAVFSFQKAKSTKIPKVIRTWWIFSFLQSVAIVVFDLRSILATHEDIGFEEWIDMCMLVVCTYLFAISVRGKTGIRFTDSSVTEALLNPSVGQQAEVKRPCPYGRANILELVTFSWMNPVFSIGYKKPLEKNEVPDVDGKDAAEFLSDSFKKIIGDVEHRHGLSTLSIYRAMFLFIGRKAIINAGFAILSASASYVGPSLINDLVKFLGGERQYGLKRGYILAVVFLSAKVVETIAQRQWIFGARQLGMRLRAALISHIYQKGLRLSCSSRQKHTSGEIINYMSVDIQRITDVIWYTNYIWMLPIQLSLAVYVLHTNLGVGAWAGLAATLAIMACNIPLTRMQKRLQAKIMVAKDNRMKATTEVLRSMKILKLQAWDMKYLQKLESLRGEEYNWLWRSVRLSALTTFIFWGSPAFISSITFGSCILMGIPLTAGTVLSALATFRMLQDPIFTLPDLLSVFAQGKVSADRVAKYLEEEELKCDAVTQVPRNDTDYDVEIDHGIFSWELETTSPTLTDVELKVKRGMKVAICGIVGSGKSSLLSCILGEMPKLDGTVRVSGRKAYVPQTAWILSGNIRENILFGNTHDKEKYENIIQACALTKDFELFANGDLTEIGERGINMSGGQKQRIQIARSVYEDADIYLFDDPFSAVDAHTGSQLFKDCVMGILKDKTVLYVTHQVEFLPAADLILVMQDGKIVQKGKFDELLQQNIGFEAIVGAHSQALESVINAESSSRIQSGNQKSADSEDEFDTENETDDQLQGITKQESAHDVSQDISDKGRLTQEEEREKGGIGKKVYWTYLRAVHGGALVPVTIAAQSFFQIFQVASNYWMAWASPPTTATTPTVGLGLLFSVYIALSMGSALCVLFRSLLVSLIGLLTSERFFKNMLHCILRAPMSFFDSTPTGRILNRRYYIPTARELARLSQIQRAPILHHFAESLAGASSIRAYAQKDRFRKANLGLVDNHSRPWFHNVSAMEWLSFRLNMLSNFVFAFSLTLLVSLPEGFINPSIAGLAVTYALNLNSQLASIIWNICNTENKMISVERIMQYSRIPSEAPLIVDHYRPPNSWPDAGTINIRSLEVRYAEHLPSVLRNISCTIPGRKKVGIVGRTGSGKSTFIQALFRIIEPRGGTIQIDNVDILKIGLHDLRGRLSIIPQDPTMFEGTVRGNLDPLNEYPDHRVWEILDKCQLGDIVRQNPKKLDSIVVENGENWSVGQRQLFCLGRVLLKRSNVLVLDEATASVDSSTDAVIQGTIREEFRKCTVLTIAHRIHTVIDSDLILVFSEGRIIEYDTPSKLLENESSEFSRLIKEYSRRSHGFSGTANN